LKNRIVIFSLSLFLIYSCNKDSKLNKTENFYSDSLSTYIAYAKNKNLDSTKRLKFNLKAFSILESQKNNQQYRNNLFSIIEEFYSLKNDKKLKEALHLILDKSIEKKDSLNIARAYNMFGNQYINTGKNDSAYYYLLKSEKIYKKLNDSLNLGKNYIDKAFLQLFVTDYSGSELSAIQSLTYYKNFNKKQTEYLAYNLIGICSNELKNYDNAIVYHKKALDYVNKYEEIGNSSFHFRASSLNNLGYVYQNINNHEEAVNTFREALTEKNLLQDSPDIYSAIVDNLAYSKFKLGNYNGLPELFFESLRIREKNGLYSGVINNKIHLSEFYAVKKDTINSQRFANEALQLAKTTKISGDLLGSLKQLSLVEHKNSSQYSKEYIKISDSIQQEERKAKDKFARIAYETDEIIGEKDKLEEQNRTLLYFFIGTFAVGVLLFVIRTQRARNRELLLKQQQQKVNEEIYSLMISQQQTIEENRVKEKKRIAQELHDGILGRMFGARLNLDSLNKFSDEESIANRYNYLNELKNIEQDIREISHDLNREKHVLINNFVAIVHNLLEEQKSSFESDISFSIDESIQWDLIDNTTKINLYRILQESLQNINKYASAKNIRVDFKKDIDNIVLKIVDDGIGFDVNTRKKGIGLQNMLSRVNECDGIFDIDSKKGKGTAITITVPIQKNTVTA
jgi:signal transduction histidine kinase